MWQFLETHDKAKHDNVNVGKNIYEHTKVKAIPVCLCAGHITKVVGDNYHVDSTLSLMHNQRN